MPPTPPRRPPIEQLRHDIAFRVSPIMCACLTFALTDGAVPSNEGRGYVLRRILRRAVRFGRQQLGLTEPFMHQLVPVVVDSMGGAFPELKKNPSHVIELIKDEEVSFGRTLDRGIDLFERMPDAQSDVTYCVPNEFPRFNSKVEQIALSNWQTFGEQPHMRDLTTDTPEILAAKELFVKGQEFEDIDGICRICRRHDCLEEECAGDSGGLAFKLHDTYGFPIDLTRIMAEERGMTVDIAGYEKLMEQARELARAGGRAADSSSHRHSARCDVETLATGVKPTDDQPKFSHEPIKSRVIAIWNGDDLGLSPASAFEDEELAIILDRTNFYAEMGGQIGDSGLLASASGEFDVQTTRAVGGYVLHIGRIRSGTSPVGDTVNATVSPIAQPHRKKPHRHPPRQLGPSRNPRRRRPAERLARRSRKTPLRLLPFQSHER